MINFSEIKTLPVCICFIGKSGSGKSTMMYILTQNYGYVEIKSYTDREKRQDELEESSHIHVSKEEMDKIIDSGILLYFRYKKIRYCTTKEQITKHLKSCICIDQESYEKIKNRTDILFIPVHMECPWLARLFRVPFKRFMRDLYNSPITNKETTSSYYTLNTYKHSYHTLMQKMKGMDLMLYKFIEDNSTSEYSIIPGKRLNFIEFRRTLRGMQL